MTGALTRMEPEAAERPYEFDAERDDALPEIGQWYWVLETVQWEGQWTNDEVNLETNEITKRKIPKGEKVEWLACVMEVGSNYVELRAPARDGHGRGSRHHLNDVKDELRFEPNAEQVIKDNITRYQGNVTLLLAEVQEVTKRLGVVPHSEIVDGTGGDNNALAVLSSQVDTTAYKNALVQAKTVDLPALFEQVKDANENLAKWMLATTLPTRALMGPMKNGVKLIEDRIYTIELYAGLTEEAVKIADGDPAKTHEPLRVMQRRLYMDEECLLDYDAGGIELRTIHSFDEWIARPHNRDRLLPFPRTLVAFRVRRETKEREDGGNMMTCFINAQIKEADKKTFIYVRNGEQVWRVDCDFMFDEMIIPNQEDFDPSGPMMVKRTIRDKEDMMPKARFDSLCEVFEKSEAWRKEWEGKPKEKNRVYYSGDNPFRNEMPYGFRPGEWSPFDDSNIYYDEAMSAVEAEMKRYNRVAVIIQGLFDRSLVLHPHPPVQVWNPDSFARSVELVYDGKTLTYGDKPDFEAYRAKLNASLGPDSIVTGQEDVWMKLEAERENERQRNNYRDSHRKSNYVRLRPHGNPGPGLVAKMDEWKPRARKAVFRWMVDMEDWRRWSSGQKPKTVTAAHSDLLNVSAYTPGDYKQFFQDPRTREEYLKWAPLMLAAEDYHAGKLALGKAGSKGNDWD